MTKLISRKIVNGNEVSVYRHPIMAGMQFCYTKGKTINNKLHQVGHYDYEIITSALGETLSEKSFNKQFYNK
jgi:hypothetical protein